MTATFYVGDAIEVMNRLPEKSVDLILTSPPFLALRSYLPSDHPDKGKEGGSQSTPGEFIDWLLDVAEACDRVLAPHGSLCIELGDTYAGSNSSGVPFDPGRFEFEGDARDAGETPGGYAVDTNEKYERIRGKGFKQGVPNLDYKQQGGGTGWPLAKSLSLIPESFRWAMVYGRNPFTGRTTEPWRLRNVIRWVRPNPPVGALGDKFRPATSELMVFCKSAKRYFDLDAVREPYAASTVERGDGGSTGMTDNGRGVVTDVGRRLAERKMTQSGAPPLDWWNIPLLEGEEETRYGPGDKPKAHARTAKGVEAQPRAGKSAERGGNWASLPELHETAGAPPLDWWEIPPGGYEGAHYAVFPPELCVKPVKAMSPERVCRVCGEPSRRISEVGSTDRIARLIRDGRDALGLDREDLVPLFIGHYKNAESVKAQVSNWELGKNMPSGRDWALLKSRLNIGDDWDHLLPDREAVTYTPQSGPGRGTAHLPPKVNPAGRGFEWHEATRNGTDRFSDCGHDDWRPGMVLDPFVGSGTTLMVATGHGRDAIGIDLDERNFDLALERVGPFILSLGEFDE